MIHKFACPCKSQIHLGQDLTQEQADARVEAMGWLPARLEALGGFFYCSERCRARAEVKHLAFVAFTFRPCGSETPASVRPPSHPPR